MAHEKEQPKPVRYKLAKGDGLDIPGIPFKITNENLNTPNVLKIIARVEAQGKHRHFGVTIVKA